MQTGTAPAQAASIDELIGKFVRQHNAARNELRQRDELDAEIAVKKQRREAEAAIERAMGAEMWERFKPYAQIEADGKSAWRIRFSPPDAWQLSHFLFHGGGWIVGSGPGFDSAAQVSLSEGLGRLFSIARAGFAVYLRDVKLPRAAENGDVDTARSVCDEIMALAPQVPHEYEIGFSGDWKERMLVYVKDAKRAQERGVQADEFDADLTVWYDEALAIHARNLARVAAWETAHANDAIELFALQYGVTGDGDEISTESVWVTAAAPDAEGYWATWQNSVFEKRRYRHWVSVGAPVLMRKDDARLATWALRIKDEKFTRGVFKFETIKLVPRTGTTRDELGAIVLAELGLEPLPELPARPEWMGEHQFSDALCRARVAVHEVRGEKELPF